MSYEFVLDTWAWVEYFRGSAAGKRVKELMEAHHAATPLHVIAELSDFYAREKQEGLERDVQFIESKTALLSFGKETAIRAGKTKNAMRIAGRKGFGLADALAWELSKEAGAKLVTGDPHFNGLDSVEFLSR